MNEWSCVLHVTNAITLKRIAMHLHTDDLRVLSEYSLRNRFQELWDLRRPREQLL